MTVNGSESLGDLPINETLGGLLLHPTNNSLLQKDTNLQHSSSSIARKYYFQHKFLHYTNFTSQLSHQLPPWSALPFPLVNQFKSIAPNFIQQNYGREWWIFTFHILKLWIPDCIGLCIKRSFVLVWINLYTCLREDSRLNSGVSLTTLSRRLGWGPKRVRFR